MSNEFQIIIKREDFSSIMIMGDVDILTSKYLDNFFEDIVGRCNCDINIDCDNITYIDSCGINALVKALMQIKKKGYSISLTKVSNNMKKLFSITNLDKTFKIAG